MFSYSQLYEVLSDILSNRVKRYSRLRSAAQPQQRATDESAPNKCSHGRPNSGNSRTEDVTVDAISLLDNDHTIALARPFSSPVDRAESESARPSRSFPSPSRYGTASACPTSSTRPSLSSPPSRCRPARPFPSRRSPEDTGRATPPTSHSPARS